MTATNSLIDGGSSWAGIIVRNATALRLAFRNCVSDLRPWMLRSEGSMMSRTDCDSECRAFRKR